MVPDWDSDSKLKQANDSMWLYLDDKFNHNHQKCLNDSYNTLLYTIQAFHSFNSYVDKNLSKYTNATLTTITEWNEEILNEAAKLGEIYTSIKLSKTISLSDLDAFNKLVEDIYIKCDVLISLNR